MTSPTSIPSTVMAGFVDDRCHARATDPTTTRYPRADGWRCGELAGHDGPHVLYNTDGESYLYPGAWIEPDPTVVRAQRVVHWAEAVRDVMGVDAAEFFVTELLRLGYVRGAA